MIIPNDYQKPGTNFLTSDDSPLQVGILCHPRSYKIIPHVHIPTPRQISSTQEVLFIRKGKMRVDFYDDEESFLESHILETGDTIYLATAGHGFEMLEDCEIIEAKTGPYMGSKDKKRFEPK